MQNNAGNELAIIMPDEWRVMQQQAEALVASGFLPPSVNHVQKALAIMSLGRELGIGAWAALNGINVIQGRATVSPQLMLAMINAKGHMEDMQISDDGQACTVIMKRRGRSPHSYSFSDDDAQSLGLLSKDNWRKQKKIMRQWRAVAGCARVVFPDDIMNLYTPDEMGAEVIADEQGNMTIVDVKRENAPRLVEKNDTDVVAGEVVEESKPSASVSGVGIVKPSQQPAEPPQSLDFDNEFPPFGVEAGSDGPPNLYHVTALLIHINTAKTSTQYILKAGTTRIPVTNTLIFEPLRIQDIPVLALNPPKSTEYVVAWDVEADNDADGWHVQSIAEALVPA